MWTPTQACVYTHINFNTLHLKTVVWPSKHRESNEHMWIISRTPLPLYVVLKCPFYRWRLGNESSLSQKTASLKYMPMSFSQPGLGYPFLF